MCWKRILQRFQENQAGGKLCSYSPSSVISQSVFIFFLIVLISGVTTRTPIPVDLCLANTAFWEQIQPLCEELKQLSFRNVNQEGTPEDIARMFSILTQLLCKLKNKNSFTGVRLKNGTSEDFIPYERIQKRKRASGNPLS
mmetsp:Transcript_8956/g.12325  ORF Transcript_8956/g.12325 Transcript_8956/m.12325 type:complete len:141 (+) Transcript_8956:250-672(+)